MRPEDFVTAALALVPRGDGTEPFDTSFVKTDTGSVVSVGATDIMLSVVLEPAKNRAQLFMLFALDNLLRVRRRLIAQEQAAGELPNAGTAANHGAYIAPEHGPGSGANASRVD